MGHKTNMFVFGLIQARVGQQQKMLGTRGKLAWFGHITRHKELAKMVLQGTLDQESGRKHGRQAKYWAADKLKEWTRLDSPSLNRWTEDRLSWRSL